MPNGDTNTGAPGGVGSLPGAIISVSNVIKGDPKERLSATKRANAILQNRREQEIVAARIAAALAAGTEVRGRDIRKQAKLLIREKELIAKLEGRRQRKPEVFERAGLPSFLSIEQFLAAVNTIRRNIRRDTKLARRLAKIGGIAQMIFAPPPAPPPAPGPQIFPPQFFQPTEGRVSMPFQISPGFDTGTGGLNFGGFVDKIIDVGRQLFTPPPTQISPFPGPRQAAFPLVPFLGPAARSLIPSIPQIGGGIVGGEFADAIQNLLKTGGASTQDDAAAFTDPVPGACRPKAHLKVNPCTGKEVWFSPRGRPMLFSGDLATCKRVARVNKRVQKAMPPKHHHHRTSHRKR